MQTEKGFILSYLKYSDRDAILHVFGQEHGYQSFYLSGVFTPRSKWKAYLMPLKEVQLNLLQSKSSSALKRLASIEALDSTDWSENIKASSVVFFVADFLSQVLREESKNLSLYGEISSFSHELQKGNFQSHLIFISRLLEIQGLYPLVSNQPYLNPESGEFTLRQSHHLFNSEISELYRQILANPQPYEVRIPPIRRAAFLESLIVYYQYHLANFKAPRSLAVVKQLF